MATITEFLAPVRLQVATILNIKDENDNIDVDNASLVYVSEMTYNHMCNYANRIFHAQAGLIEIYNNYQEILELKTIPIDSVTEIKYLETDTEVDSSDYTVYNNKINLQDAISLYKYEVGYKPLKITYSGGYDTADLHKTLYSLLIQQTIAWYNNRTTIGYTTYNFNGIGATKTNMVFDLLDSVKMGLDNIKYNSAIVEDF